MAKKAAKKKAASRKTNYQLAAQLYTLRDFTKTAKDFEKTMMKVRKIGYRLVQISAVGPMPAAEIRQILDDTGMVAIGHHCGMHQLRDDFKGLVDYLHTIGSKYTGIGALPGEMRGSAAMYKKAAVEMAKYGRMLKKEDITLQYHNHAFEFHKFNNKSCLEIIYETAAAKDLQAEIDTYWVSAGGGDPIEWIHRMKGRMDQIHFKDGLMLDNAFTICEIGQGNLNWPGILEACKKIKVKWYLVEQDICPVTKDPFKSLEISYKFLSKMGLK